MATTDERRKRIAQAKRKDRRIRSRRIWHRKRGRRTPVLDRAQARSRAFIATLVRRQRRALRRRGADAAISWARTKLGVTESPAGSNRDNRKHGITAWQRRLGEWLIGKAWCGVFVANAWLEAGLRIAQPWRWAAVRLIEDDARAGRNGLKGWAARDDGQPGDLAVIGGRGIHVELIVRRVSGGYRCIGGNTSPAGRGSLANGGGVFQNYRPYSSVHGVAVIDQGEVRP